MKNIYKFDHFLEYKKYKTEEPEIVKDNPEIVREVKKIINEMFDVAKDITFTGKKEPEFVEFETNKVEFDVWNSYNKRPKDKEDEKFAELRMDYTENVLKKRKYQVSLMFKDVYTEKKGEKSVYKIKFEIILKPTSEIDFSSSKEEIGWKFDEKPKKVIEFIEDEGEKCEWDKENSTLYMNKSSYDRVDKLRLRTLIEKSGGVKIKVK